MKKTRSRSVYKRSLSLENTAKLLVVHPLFQKRVKEIRKRIKLRKLLPYEPTVESVKANAAFDLRLNEKTDDFRNSDIFIDAERKLSLRLKRGDINEREYCDGINAVLEEAPANYLRVSIEKMIKTFRLTPNFFESLRAYTLNGIMAAPKRNYALIEEYDRYGTAQIVMELYAPLSDAEKVEAFKRMDNLLKKGKQYLRKGYRPYREIDRDLRIYSASLTKGKNMTTDMDLAGSLFEDVDDTSFEADRKRRAIIWQSRARLKKALRKHFPSDTFTGT